MTIIAKSLISLDTRSLEAGQRAGVDLLAAFGGETIRAVIAYATVNHDQSALIRGLRSEIGDSPVLIGCSTQGIVGDGTVIEQGYASGFMALGGAGIEASGSLAKEVQTDTRNKGIHLARDLKQSLSMPPKAVVLFWDPLSGVDIAQLVAGLKNEIKAPIVGGAASQPWGPMVQTFQYFCDDVVSNSAGAMAITGPFDVQTAHTHGATQAGIEMTVTRAKGNTLLELDGQPALDVWSEMIDTSATNSVDDTAAWAIGVQRQAVGDGKPEWSVLAAFGFDHDTKGVVVQSSIPEGTVLMFHHRTAEAVLKGAARMGEELRERLVNKTVRAVLGFECGARTSPFLGPSATNQEHENLQKSVSKDAAWLGMLAWGELVPSATTSTFCNYTYPLMVLHDL